MQYPFSFLNLSNNCSGCVLTLLSIDCATHLSFFPKIRECLQEIDIVLLVWSVNAVTHPGIISRHMFVMQSLSCYMKCSSSKQTPRKTKMIADRSLLFVQQLAQCKRINLCVKGSIFVLFSVVSCL